MSDSGFASLTCNLGGAEKDFSEEIIRLSALGEQISKVKHTVAQG